MRKMKTSLFKLTVITVILALSLPLFGCSILGGTEVEEVGAVKTVVHLAESDQQEDADKLTMRLGSSLYAIQTAVEFTPIRVSNEEWEDDMMARYHNTVTMLDFAVYQFSKEGYADTLEEFALEEAKEYEAYEVVTDMEINGIPVAYYRSMEEYQEDLHDGITVVLDADKEYLEIDFLFESDSNEDEAWEIVRTLTRVGVEPVSLGRYYIEMPVDFVLLSDIKANPVVFMSGSSSLNLYIFYTPALLGNTLSSFALASGGSDIETDGKINDISVATYRSVEPFDGAYYSVWSYILPDGNPHAPDGFITLSFRLNGISAEAEAENIMESLAKTLSDHNS